MEEEVKKECEGCKEEVAVEAAPEVKEEVSEEVVA